MKRHPNWMGMAAFATILLVASATLAGPWNRDAGAKMRGEFGGATGNRASPTYRMPAPIVVETTPAPESVAEAPNMTRRYSVDPGAVAVPTYRTYTAPTVRRGHFSWDRNAGSKLLGNYGR